MSMWDCFCSLTSSASIVVELFFSESCVALLMDFWDMGSSKVSVWLDFWILGGGWGSVDGEEDRGRRVPVWEVVSGVVSMDVVLDVIL